MKAVSLLPALALLVASFHALPAEACWISLSPGELVERADLIVIGEIKGISGEEQAEGGMWRTFWEVEARYFLKGEEDYALLIVATPGARNKQPQISTYYRLNDWGNSVLLFLEHRDGYLEPPTPQGVIAVRRSDAAPLSPPTGERLLQQYTICDEKITQEEKAELESYIKELPRVVAASGAEDAGAGDEGGPLDARYIFPAALLALAVLTALFRSRKNKITGR